jgi:tetrahydromethanopterin S-methyltransferase subunit F
VETQIVGSANAYLAIMAFTSALEALVIIGVGIALFVMYRRMTAMYREVMHVIELVDAKHVTPAMARVNAILDDVKDVTGTVRRDTDKVVRGIRRNKARIIGLARGAGFAVRALMKNPA